MRSPEEISASARDVRAFSNGTEGYAWMGNWCHECKHDDEETEKWCPILTLAMIGEKTPAEWVEKNPYGLGDQLTIFDEMADQLLEAVRVAHA